MEEEDDFPQVSGKIIRKDQVLQQWDVTKSNPNGQMKKVTSFDSQIYAESVNQATKVYMFK